MRAIINGSLTPVRKSLDISYDPSRGRVVTQEFESAGDNLGGIAATCEANRIAYNWRSNPVRSHISLTATGAQAGVLSLTADTWQLLCNENQNDIKQHPKVLAGEATLSGMIGQVVADVDSLNKGEDIDDSYYGTAPAIAIQLRNLLIRGTTHYAVNQYVLRHTANVPNDFTGMDQDLGAELIYTTAQLLAEISSGWIFNCPLRLRTKISHIDTGRAAHTDYAWGWLKKGGTETTAANNRVDISSEYVFFEWSTVLYDLHS